MARIILGGTKIKEKQKPYYRMTVIVDDNVNEVATVEVNFKESTTGGTLPDPPAYTLTKSKESNGEKTFTEKKITFPSGSNPVGQTYKINLTMLDAGQKPVGRDEIQEVTLEATSDIALKSIILKLNTGAGDTSNTFTFNAVFYDVPKKTTKVKLTLTPTRSPRGVGSEAKPSEYLIPVTEAGNTFVVEDKKITFADPKKVVGFTYSAYFVFIDKHDNEIDTDNELVIATEK